MRKLALHWQILIAILLAIVVGYTINQVTTDANVPSVFGIAFVTIFDYIGTMFLNALRMIIVPLITSSIIIGVAGIGSGGNLGALGGKTLLFYGSTTLAAILVGLLVINVIGPGYVDGEPARELLALDAAVEDISSQIEGRGVGDVAEVFLRMVPPRISRGVSRRQSLNGNPTSIDWPRPALSAKPIKPRKRSRITKVCTTD